MKTILKKVFDQKAKRYMPLQAVETAGYIFENCMFIEKDYDFIVDKIDEFFAKYSDERWCIMEAYCTPENANLDEAYDSFVSDILRVIEKEGH